MEEERREIIKYERSFRLPRVSVQCMLEWEGNIISGHGGCVFITTENESKEISKERCHSLVLLSKTLYCIGTKNFIQDYFILENTITCP